MCVCAQCHAELPSEKRGSRSASVVTVRDSCVRDSSKFNGVVGVFGEYLRATCCRPQPVLADSPDSPRLQLNQHTMVCTASTVFTINSAAVGLVALSFVLRAMYPRHAPDMSMALSSYATKCFCIGAIKIIGGVVLAAYQWSTCADPPIYPVVCIALGFVQLGRGAQCRRMATKVGGAGLTTSYARAT